MIPYLCTLIHKVGKKIVLNKTIKLFRLLDVKLNSKPNLIKSPDGGMADTLGLEPSFLTGVQVQVLLGALCRSSSVGRAPDL